MVRARVRQDEAVRLNGVRHRKSSLFVTLQMKHACKTRPGKTGIRCTHTHTHGLVYNNEDDY